MNQTVLPTQCILVNDQSTDNSVAIVERYLKRYDFLILCHTEAEEEHLPGAKVIRAFNKGVEFLTEDYDFIGKFDADLRLPLDYFERVLNLFHEDETIGLASGILFIEKEGRWKYEKVVDKTVVRGPVKLYRKACFQQIEGLKTSMGWDTVDQLKALYHGWQVQTDQSLIVRHLKPTTSSYSKKGRYKQGEAFYKIGYGLPISLIASIKIALNTKQYSRLINNMIGYFKAYFGSTKKLVNKDEQRFIRTTQVAGDFQKIECLVNGFSDWRISG